MAQAERDVSYDRQRLVDVLIHHQPTSTSGCICGWGVLGASHPEHVAEVYEAASIEWNEALDLDEAIRAACLPNMRKAFSGEPVTARDIADEQAALDSIRMTKGHDDD